MHGPSPMRPLWTRALRPAWALQAAGAPRGRARRRPRGVSSTAATTSQRTVSHREITAALDRMQQHALQVRDAAGARSLIDQTPDLLLTLEEGSPEERRLMEISVYL